MAVHAQAHSARNQWLCLANLIRHAKTQKPHPAGTALGSSSAHSASSRNTVFMLCARAQDGADGSTQQQQDTKEGVSARHAHASGHHGVCGMLAVAVTTHLFNGANVRGGRTTEKAKGSNCVLRAAP